jgi:hypothetical protein
MTTVKETTTATYIIGLPAGGALYFNVNICEKTPKGIAGKLENIVVCPFAQTSHKDNIHNIFLELKETYINYGELMETLSDRLKEHQ